MADTLKDSAEESLNDYVKKLGEVPEKVFGEIAEAIVGETSKEIFVWIPGRKHNKYQKECLKMFLKIEVEGVIWGIAEKNPNGIPKQTFA